MIQLPEQADFATAQDIESYAVRCFALLNLADWSFGFDRAVRRLGCCRLQEKRITLSRHFVAAYLARGDSAQIHRTLRHELAHALAWTHHRRHGHGAVWKRYCAALGIPDERATTKCADFAPERTTPRRIVAVLCHDVTGEVFKEYTRRPRHRAAYYRRCYIPGRKEETLGHLILAAPKSDDDAPNSEKP